MAERRYTKTHEWLTVDGKTVTVGITDFAQSQLGDVVFLELPAAGPQAQPPARRFGVVESVKAASDLYSPVAGTDHGRQRQAGGQSRARSTPIPTATAGSSRSSWPATLPADLLDEAAYKKVAEA